MLTTLAFAMVAATLSARSVTGDWEFFVSLSEQLTTGRWALVYADHPNAQSGPLSLLAVQMVEALGSGVFPIVIGVLGILTLMILSRTQSSISGTDTRLLLGGIVLALWWPYLKTSGHLDDALVLTLVTLSLLLVLRGRPIPAAVLIGITLALKPWALFMLPMLMSLDDVRARRITAPLVAIGVGAAFWSPFLLGSSKTLDGLRPTVRLAPDSVLRLFGIDSANVPPLLRYLQLGLALVAVAIVAILRGRPAGALLAGVAVRLLLDPGTWNYYTVGFLLGALTWDLSQSNRVPWATLAACALVPPTWIIDVPELRLALRLVVCLCALAIVLWPDDGVAPEQIKATGRSERRRPTAPMCSSADATSSSPFG